MVGALLCLAGSLLPLVTLVHATFPNSTRYRYSLLDGKAVSLGPRIPAGTRSEAPPPWPLRGGVIGLLVTLLGAVVNALRRPEDPEGYRLTRWLAIGWLLAFGAGWAYLEIFSSPEYQQTRPLSGGWVLLGGLCLVALGSQLACRAAPQDVL